MEEEIQGMQAENWHLFKFLASFQNSLVIDKWLQGDPIHQESCRNCHNDLMSNFWVSSGGGTGVLWAKPGLAHMSGGTQYLA